MMLSLGDVIGGGAPSSLFVPFNPVNTGQAEIDRQKQFMEASVPPLYPGGPWRTPAQASLDDAAAKAAPGAEAYKQAYSASIAAGGTEAAATLLAANAANAAANTANKAAAGTAAGSQDKNVADSTGMDTTTMVMIAGAAAVGLILVMKKQKG